ncbi:lysR family transcriptional regulator [Acetobacter aceti NRIC 0242]|uniref:LysR family transcriptional regulator n=2 Tax=Acetobacter aceti TaxID=435 RepID=A0AB33IFK9_ACEAC|nr:LysR family transcriptional regulator [Acetobacter aceti NBRC 14818]BCK76813.1 LysR family transcriptional regulator [Acetobacter aceti NBRC 14818]GAN56916.1 transcriptional regulator LysR [Acetobacter aceti NBRC 14818]GBO81752.1 lysR family transcriptional regulator [Acetobacter aceti NRIC 0242]
MLGLTQPTVRHRIEALEHAIGQPLFSRNVNGLVPTDEARELAVHVRRMAFASEAFYRAASGVGSEIAGTVRISVAEFVGIEIMPLLLASLRDSHPELELELVLSNENADLLGQEVDIAIRMHRPCQGALVTKRVGCIPLGFFAAGSYLERHGVPKCAADLAAHTLIGSDRSRMDRDFTRELQKKLGQTLYFALRTDSHPAQLAMMRTGLGIGVTQLPIGERDLVRVLPGLIVAELEAWVVAHADLRHSHRIDAVFRHLAANLRQYCTGTQITQITSGSFPSSG